MASYIMSFSEEEMTLIKYILGVYLSERTYDVVAAFDLEARFINLDGVMILKEDEEN